jgi:hypothetical protein
LTGDGSTLGDYLRFVNGELFPHLQKLGENGNATNKQKVIAEIERARVIVIIGDFPMEVLSGYKLKAGLLILNSVRQSVKSHLWTLYLLPKGTDFSDLNNVKNLKVTKEEDMKEVRKRLWPFGVALVDEKLGIYKSASTILKAVLSSHE